jgi:NADPH2:quinone reductase
MNIMKAIHLTQYGNSDRAFKMMEIDIPTPGPNEIVIKTIASGLNFADVVARRGLYPDAPKNPAILGYDVSGTIHAMGQNVKDFEIGQKVVGLTRFGGYAEYAVAMSEGVSILPDDFDYHKATALATQACTAYFCAEECTSLHPGDQVLVQAAAGGVGSLLVQLAKHRGCTVYGTASSTKQAFLTEIGVDHPIDYTKGDFKKIIKGRCPEGIDVVFDSIGGKSFSKGMKLLGPGGRMISYGAASQINGKKTNKLLAAGVVFGFGLFTPIALLMESKSIITVNMLRIADHRPQVFKHVLTEVVKLAKQGVINPELSKTFKAVDIAEAHDYLESRQSIGKVTISWD